jgi:hypothetical protein
MPSWLPKRLHRFATKVLLLNDGRGEPTCASIATQVLLTGLPNRQRAAGKNILTHIQLEYRPPAPHQ